MRRSRISLLTALVSLSAVSVSGCRSSQKHTDSGMPDSSATQVYEASPDYPDYQGQPSRDDSRELRGPSPVPEPPRVPPALGVSHVKQVGFASRIGEKISRPFGFTTPNATSNWQPEDQCAENQCADGSCTDQSTCSDTCADPLECAKQPECAELQPCTAPDEGCSIPECAPAKKPLGTRFMETLKAPAKLFKSKKTQDCVTEAEGCVASEAQTLGCTTPFPKRYFQHDSGPCGEDTGCGCTEFPVTAELRKELTRQTLAESMPDPILDQEDHSDLVAEPLIPMTAPQVDSQVAFGAYEKIPVATNSEDAIPVLGAITNETAPAPPLPVDQSPQDSSALTNGLPVQRADDVPLWPRLRPQPEVKGQPLKSTPSTPMNTTTPVRQISTGGNGLPVIQPRQFP